MFAILALVLGVSFFFSMAGMGGGQAYTPAFFWMGMDVRNQAVPLALWLSFATQSTAAVNYWRHGLVRIRTGIPIVVGLIGFAPLGAIYSHRVPDRVILFLFASMTLAAIIQTLSGWKPRGAAGYRRAELIVIGLIVGAGVGFLGGMIGRSGGSVLVPILLLLGFEPKNAAATSSFSATFCALTGFLGHVSTQHLQIAPLWLAVFTAAAMLGAFAGSRAMAERMRGTRVKRLFVILLFGIAVKLYWDVFVG